MWGWFCRRDGGDRVEVAVVETCYFTYTLYAPRAEAEAATAEQRAGWIDKLVAFAGDEVSYLGLPAGWRVRRVCR